MSLSYEKINILVAYPYMTNAVYKTLKKYQNYINLLIDCGAFTANSKGKVITLDQYCNFLDSLDIPVWKYFMLDVIGNSQKTMTQYLEMLKRGYKPIPIFTQGQKFEDLDIYYSSSDIVGIGSLVGTKGNKEYIKYIMKMANGRNVHWLGFTILDFIKKFRPFSCDSSSFGAGARYGKLHLYMGQGKQMKLLGRKDFLNQPSIEIIERIKFYGYDPKDCSQSLHWKSQNTMPRLGVASWVALLRDIKKNLMTNLFLACNTSVQLEMVMKEFFYQSKQRLT